jgi:hypothetical protein
MKEWKEERCAERPDELQVIAPGVYMQRRNIEKVEHDALEGMPSYIDYRCECREITVSEYETLKSIEEINTSRAIDEYTKQLIEEGVI